MSQRSFEIQRDHAELLIGVTRLLTRGGMAIFSCNLRRFKPDLEKLARAGVTLHVDAQAKAAVETAQGELDAANQKVSDLESQIAEVQKQIDDLKPFDSRDFVEALFEGTDEKAQDEEEDA